MLLRKQVSVRNEEKKLVDKREKVLYCSDCAEDCLLFKTDLK